MARDSAVRAAIHDKVLGRAKKREGRQTLLVIREYPAEWILRKLSFAVVARFRKQGLLVSEIAARTGAPQATVYRRMQAGI